MPLELLSTVGGLTPFALLDVTQYLKNWYSLNKRTLIELKALPDPESIDKAQEEIKKEKLKLILETSDLFEIKEVSRSGKIAGEGVYIYLLIPKKENVRSTLAKITELLQDRTLTKSEESQLDSFVDELSKAKITAWIGKKDYYLRKLTVMIPNFSYGAIRLDTSMTFEFSDFNTAIVKKPSGYITFDDELKNLSSGFFWLECRSNKIS